MRHKIGEGNSEWTCKDLLFLLYPEGAGTPDFAIGDKNCDSDCSPEQGGIERSDNGFRFKC